MTQSIGIAELFITQGTKFLSDVPLTDDGLGRDYQSRLLDFGHVDRSMAYPPANGIQISDGVIKVADTDEEVRQWCDQNTLRRRLAKIKLFTDEDVAETLSVDDIIPAYTGEIDQITFESSNAQIRLIDSSYAWFQRELPSWGRDDFPNLPPDVQTVFIPLVFGRNESSFSPVSELSQGVVNCPYVDALQFRYAVNMHSVWDVIAVYRKRSGEGIFTIVDIDEYDIVAEAKTLNGFTYTITYIQFLGQQEDGTEIRADVSGVNMRGVFASLAAITNAEIRNGVDHLINLIGYVFVLENREAVFNEESFVFLWGQVQNELGIKCDIFFDEPITAGEALRRICFAMGVDIRIDQYGRITIAKDPIASTARPGYFNNSFADAAVQFDKTNIEQGTFKPSTPPKTVNRLHVRYAWYGGDQWGFQIRVDNLDDQAELQIETDSGDSDKFEEETIELHGVRDDATALAIAKAWIGYFTLRSHIVKFSVKAPKYSQALDLGTFIVVTHEEGIKDWTGVENMALVKGWLLEPFKVIGLTQNLTARLLDVIAVRQYCADELNLSSEFEDSGHPAQDPGTSSPPTFGTVDGTPVAQIILSSTNPAAPAGYRNGIFQRDTGTGETSVYEPNLGGVNHQTGTSYTITAGDSGKLVTFSNSSAIAVSLPVTLANTFMCFIENLGAGTATLTPVSGQINGAASMALTTGQGGVFFFDGTNWSAVTGGGGGSSAGATVEAKTNGSGAPYAVSATTDLGKTFTNEGASAEVYFALPTAATSVGPYTFICQDADLLRIVANTGDTIRLYNNVSATAGYIKAVAIGSAIRLVAINATEWMAEAVVGEWDVN